MAWYASGHRLVRCVLIVHSAGYVTSESDFYWCRGTPFSMYSSQFFRAGHFDIKILQAAKDLHADRDTLVDIFGRIETFLKRLEIYAEVPPNEEMVDTITKIMVEVLSILAIATKEMKQGQTSKSILYRFVITVDRNILRNISKEVGRKDRCRGCAEEARQADARGGSNGHCPSPTGHV